MAETTGRYLVLLPEGATTLRGAAEVFPNLGVAVLDDAPRALAAADYLAIEPERVVYAIQDESQATWGLQATNVVASAYTGAGVKVAVLDTGLDLEHPDFEGRDDHDPFVRLRPGRPGRQRARHALHRHGLRARRRGPALRDRVRGRDLRRQGPQQRRLRQRLADPRRHRLGGGQRLRGRLDVARRGGRGRRRLLDRVRDRGAAGVGGRDADRGRRGQQRPEPARQPPRELPLDHGRGRGRLEARGGGLLRPRAGPGGRRDRLRGPGRRRLLERPDARALRPLQRHEHGHAARRGDRGPARRGRPRHARARPRRGAQAHGEATRPAYRRATPAPGWSRLPRGTV